MAQVGSALAADGLNALHVMAEIGDFCDSTRDGLAEAGPAAASVELGTCGKQGGATAHTGVLSRVPVIEVLARKRWLGMCVTGDLVGQWFGILGAGKFGVPLCVCFFCEGGHGGPWG